MKKPLFEHIGGNEFRLIKEVNNPKEVEEMLKRIINIAIQQRRYPRAIQVKYHDAKEELDIADLTSISPWWDIGVFNVNGPRDDYFVTFSKDTGWTYGEKQVVLDNNQKVNQAIKEIVDKLPPMRG